VEDAGYLKGLIIIANVEDVSYL
jgi:hypothetical protein